LSTKIHAATEALGLPIRLIASPGQRNDIAFAHALVDGIDAKVALADKGYDADHLCDKITEAGDATESTCVPTTLNSTRNAIASNASSTSSNSSDASQPDTTSCLPTSWGSSNSPQSQSGSNS
jgi:IS5 family transposase